MLAACALCILAQSGAACSLIVGDGDDQQDSGTGECEVSSTPVDVCGPDRDGELLIH